jgi:hypothetical protein
MLVSINVSLKRIGYLMCLLFWSLLACGTAFGDDWGVLAFREDFSAGVGEANMPDPNIWVCNHPCNWWFVLGRTFWPSPKYHPTGPFPRVENGVCAIEHHLYNPWHLGTPKTTFLGEELHTARMFAPNTSYRFEAKVKCNTYPNGLVTSFFLYGYDCSNSDEVDFEFVSNKTNDDVNYPNGDPVLTNVWNESQQWPEYKVDGNLNDWNTFRIYWYPGERVDWTWLDPLNGEVLLRSEMDPNRIPDEPMGIYFNFWAPNADWQDAYDANFQPVSDPNANQIYEYEIDYVEVRVPQQVCGDVNHLHPEPDLDYDCYVNMFDYSSFSGHWQKDACGREDCCGGADLNGDCAVNFVDIGILVAYWLECTDPNAPCGYNP